MDTGEKFKAARAAAGLTQEQAVATREKVCWCTCWLEKNTGSSAMALKWLSKSATTKRRLAQALLLWLQEP